MGGHLTVTSRENQGSTFTFVLLCKLSPKGHPSDDPEEATVSESILDEYAECYSDLCFSFQPCTLGSMSSGAGSVPRLKQLSTNNNVLSKLDYSQVTSSTSRDSISGESACSITNINYEKFSENECCTQGSATIDAKILNGRGENRNGLIMSRYQGPALGGVCTQNGLSTSEIKNSNASELTKHCSSKLTKAISQPKILLVEDNKINIMVANSMMKQMGHAIEIVNNGLEAIRAVQHTNYDLILMVISSSCVSI